jgi:hypothetical protein
MTRPILIAGLLGGLLGGVASFSASRLLVPAGARSEQTQAVPAGPVAVPADARQVAEGFVAQLREGKFEQFAISAKLGKVDSTDADFAAFKVKLLESRTVFTNTFGPSSTEFELLRETALSPSLVRFVYLERFERGGVLWVFVMYHGTDSGWRLSWVDYGTHLAGIFAGLS